MRLSVVLPTFNEAETIGPLLRELDEAFAGVEAEWLVVDDDSPDGTADAARDASVNARVIVRTEERGLATAVVRGLREARGQFVAVMDADGQHPPEAVRRMLRRAESRDAELVVGSRHVEGGGDAGLGPLRKLVSQGATQIARVLLPPVRRHGVTDPMTGLFLVRRDRIEPAVLQPTGYKILLEILGRHDFDRVEEVGYRFRKRRGGESKLGASVMVQYLMHVAALALVHPDNRRLAKFGLVGLSGVGVNLGLLWLLAVQAGLHELAAVTVAVETSIVWNFLLNDSWTFHDRRTGHRLLRLLKFNLVSLGAMSVNVATFFVMRQAFGVPLLASEAIAIAVAFGVNYLGNHHWTYGALEGREIVRRSLPWVPFLLVLAGAAFGYFHALDDPDEIYFDEHHYLSVARQLDNDIWYDPCWEHGGDHSDPDDPWHGHPRPVNYEHPPLAKLMIAWSIERFDTDHHVFPGCREPDSDAYDTFTTRMREEGNPFAWRAPSAVMGIVTVAFAGLAAGRLFGGPLPAFLAGSFVLADGVVYTASRLAILDIFSAGFLMAAAYAATFASKRGVLASSILLGLGFASKYSVLWGGAGVLAVMLYSHHRAGRLGRGRWGRLGFILPVILVVPLSVWVLTYLPWLTLWSRDHGPVWALVHLAKMTSDAVVWGTTANFDHPDITPPWMWLTLEVPTLYYAPGANEEGTLVIYGVGNPVVWWLASVTGLAALASGAAWAILRSAARLRHAAERVRTWLVGLGSAAAAAAAGILAWGWSHHQDAPWNYYGFTGAVIAVGGVLALAVLVALAVALAAGAHRRQAPASLGKGAAAVAAGGAALGGLLAAAAWQAGPQLLEPGLFAALFAILTGAAVALGVAGLALAVLALTRRRIGPEPVGTSGGAVVAAALLFLFTYGGFFLTGRVQFLFYMPLVVPTLAVLLAGGLTWLWRRAPAAGSVAVVVVFALAAAVFAHYFPVLHGMRISEAELDRIWSLVPWMDR